MLDINNCFTHDGSGGLFQTVTATAVCTNPIDLGVAGLKISGSKGPYIVIRTGAAFVTCVSCQIELRTATAADLTTGAKQIQAWRFTAAQMAIATLLVNQMLPVADYQRYLGLYFTMFTSATLGTICGYLADGPEAAETDLDLVMAGT